jgi:glycosyltransferase involved in cell wall biosynthesis
MTHTAALQVAVVITFYKDDRFFPEALHSVLSQTRPPDEIVVVDDASPEGTNLTLQQVDDRVRVVRHERNQGAGAARQTGVNATSSPLIAFLDSDDIWLPQKLERQLADLADRPELDAHHVGLIRFRADGTETIFNAKPHVLDLATQLRKNQPLPSGYLVRRRSLEAVGGWRRDNLLMEDWDLNIRMVVAGRQVGFLAEPLVRFRRTDHGNLSGRGIRHLRIMLRTVWAHRDSFRREVGIRGSLAVIGHLFYHEGSVRRRMDGALFRWFGRCMGYREVRA